MNPYKSRRIKLVQFTVNKNKLEQNDKLVIIDPISKFNDLKPDSGYEYVLIAMNLDDAVKHRDSLKKVKDYKAIVHIMVATMISNSLLWFKSFGSYDTLKPYLEQTTNTPMDDEDLFKPSLSLPRNVVIISGGIKMGKTQTLKYLRSRVSENKKTTVFIDLKDYKQMIHNKESSDEILREMIEKNASNHIPTIKGKYDLSSVVVFFDSFDEISQIYNKIVFDLFDKLKDMNANLIFIGSQIHKEMDLYNYSNEIFQLEPLDKNQVLEMKNQCAEVFWKELEKDEFIPTPNFVEKISEISHLNDISPIFQIFEELFKYYFLQYFIKVLHMDTNSNFAKAELRNHKLTTYNNLSFLSIEDENVINRLEKSYRDRIKTIKGEPSIAQDLINYAPDLKHAIFKNFFIAHLMYLTFISYESTSLFWEIFECYSTETISAYFFLHRLFLGLAKIGPQDPEFEKFLMLIEKICKKNGTNQISSSFLVKMACTYKIGEDKKLQILNKIENIRSPNKRTNSSESSDKLPKRRRKQYHTPNDISMIFLRLERLERAVACRVSNLRYSEIKRRLSEPSSYAQRLSIDDDYVNQKSFSHAETQTHKYGYKMRTTI